MCANDPHILCSQTHALEPQRNIKPTTHALEMHANIFESHRLFGASVCRRPYVCVGSIRVCAQIRVIFFLLSRPRTAGLFWFGTRALRFYTHIHRHSRRPKVVSSKRKHTHIHGIRGFDRALVTYLSIVPRGIRKYVHLFCH